VPESLSLAAPLSWDQLQALAAPEPDRVRGATNAQAQLRLFCSSESDVRVTLYRDHHAWCPYCQKVWLWLEERQIPYRIRKVTMNCYGEKEGWYRQRVPSGMLPALELDGRLITESDEILAALEAAFGPLERPLGDPDVLALRQLERRLFRAWCQWLCYTGEAGPGSEPAERHFDKIADLVDGALAIHPGPWFLESFSSVDVIFTPYLERMGASLSYYKGYGLRQRHPAIDRWFTALEQRPTYLGTQSDFHTHAHDLPPQMGCCLASGSEAQRACARQIDQGPWLPAGASSALGPADAPFPSEPVALAVLETRQLEPPGAALEALARVLKHRHSLLAVNPHGGAAFDQALACALTHLVSGEACPPPAGSAAGLRYLRDRICVPRDMSLHGARRLRQALESTAQLDPEAANPLLSPISMGPIPTSHRRDQDPRRFALA
jgi:glutathione S-transferase